MRRAMMLLDDAHDRGGALRLYDTQAQRLAAEFDATPSAETVELARMIRKGREQRVANRERVAPGNGEPLAATAVSVAASPASALPATSPLAAPPAAPPSSGGTVAGARRRVAWATALSAGVVGLALVAWIAKPTHARTARKDRVVIAVFENRTGDTKYQALGRMAEDWLAQGLLRAQIVDVVDPRAVDAQGRSSGGGTVDPVTLARRTNSAMVVSGSYYRTGDSLLLEAAVTDAHAGKIVRVIGPIVARADNPVAALNDLRSRVMTALASVINIHFPADFDVAGDVPPYDAYEAYVEGWDAFWHSDGRKAEQLFLRAAQLDPTFAGAAVGLSIAAGNSGDCTLVDSVAHALAGRPEALSRFDRLSVQIGVARCHGRNDELLRLTLERAALEPRTSGLRGPAAAAALLANRPQQAVTLLESIDPSTDLVVGTDSTHVAYWGGLTEGLHLLGRHDQELTAADRASPAAPLSRAWMRARALAPMHRPAQVLLLVETMMTLPVETQNDIGLAPFTEGRPQYNQTPGWLIVWISRELAVHGDVWTSRQAASRALAWYESRSAEDRATPEERLGVAWSLELLGRYAKADTVIRALIAEDTANVDYKGILAGLAAEQGDTPLADSLDAWLATQSVDRVAFSANFYRARVAALLGRDDTAVARVRDELDEGAWPMLLHVEPTFEHLRARPDFVALMAPKG